MKRIQAKKHKLWTYKINNILLSCFDDKISVSKNGIHTRAYFHKDIDSHRIKIKKISHKKEEILTDKTGLNGYS